MKNIITTIPKARFKSWAEAEAELIISDGEDGSFWTVAATRLPAASPIGAQCFMIFDGQVRGYLDIVDTDEAAKWGFHSESAGGKAPHVFVLANWHPIEPQPMTGFQGWRYTELRP